MEPKRKRQVAFAPGVELDQAAKKQRKHASEDNAGSKRLHSGKYTLESDEEDDDEQDNSKQMKQDDLDEIGQEQATIGFDDQVKITPFNIDEEMEEGHYDESGCFHWRKKDEVHDAWLDEVDWNDVKNYKLKNAQATGEDLEDPEESNRADDEDDDEKNGNKFDERNTVKAMLAIMQPGETVVRTIKRLGVAATSNKSKQRVRQQQQQRKPLPGEIPTAAPIEQTPEELKKNKLLLEEMTGLADQFVSNGDLDIYQETFERLKAKLDRASTSTSSNASTFDMYGDTDVTSSATTTSSALPTTLWEYITDEKDAENIQGPFTTEHMIRLNDTDGKLDKEKVRCRRVGTDQFYSLKRIDFELYLD